MMITVHMRENFEELPGSGGSFGVNMFERQEWPAGEEERKSLLLSLCEMADKVDTITCDFSVEEEGKIIAKGSIKNCKEVYWQD